MNQFLKNKWKDLQGKWWFHQDNRKLIESILIITANISDRLPPPLKKIKITIIDEIGLIFFRFYTILYSLISSYYLVKANQKDNNRNICFLLKGNPNVFSSLIDKICNTITHVQPISKQKAQHLFLNINKKTENDPDVFIAKTDVFYQSYLQKKGWTIIPEHISFHLDITKDLDNLFMNTEKDIQNDIDKAKKTGYTYVLKNDAESFDLFYHKMYIPYMEWKHHRSKKIASYATIRHLAAQGAELLIIMHNQNIIFGGMFIQKGTELKTHYAGLMQGKFNHLHNGIMALSYYYLIKVAKTYNCKSIDFGTASPFLDDGLYQYKNKWNMKIVQSSPFISDIYAFKILKDDSAFEEFISNHPVHIVKGRHLEITHSK